MAFDSHKNFAYSTVATPPSQASSGTSLVLAAGEGARMPTPPFNASVWAAGVNPLPTNAEIVRVTAMATDTPTIVRAQEGSSARAIVAGDQFAAAITTKTLTDIELVATDILAAPIAIRPARIDADVTIPDGSNGLSAGPIEIGFGVLVDVEQDATWSIV